MIRVCKMQKELLMSGLPEKMRIYLAATKPLTDSGLFAQALSLVSNERREKVLRYRFMKDQRLSLGAGLLLEFALAEYGFPAGISLSYGPYGKPFLPGEDLCFSLSHSGEYVMLAAGRRKCGCDLEQIETANLDIARRFFHPAEYRQLGEAPSEKRNHLFYRFWTLKESYMKMTGEGFHLSPSDFRIGIGEEDIFLEREGIYEACHFAELSLLPSYCCSVCTEGTLPEPNVKSLDLRSVIRQLAKNRQKTDR